MPGVEISEHFPLMAKAADRYAILRSVNHKAAPIHETGPPDDADRLSLPRRSGIPALRAVFRTCAAGGPSGLPPFVVMPAPIGNTGVSVSHGQTAGYLGARRAAVLHGDPAAAGFKITDVNAPIGVDPARLKTRRELLDAVDSAHRAFDETEDSRSRDAYDQAFGLIFADKAKKAFDLTAETEGLRSRYGRNTFGQSCLLARRLLEHGVRLVTVNMFDTVFNEITWDATPTAARWPCASTTTKRRCVRCSTWRTRRCWTT